MHQPLHRFKAELFKALGHPLRIKIVETLRSGEVSVADLLGQLEVEPATASQQLGVLRSRGLVDSRREGTTVYYRLRDPLVLDLLKVARAMSAKHLVNMQELLAAEMREEGLTGKPTASNAGRRSAAVS
jgi:DNA-binding transcriptional ArsR family regulator